MAEAAQGQRSLEGAVLSRAPVETEEQHDAVGVQPRALQRPACDAVLEPRTLRRDLDQATPTDAPRCGEGVQGGKQGSPALQGHLTLGGGAAHEEDDDPLPEGSVTGRGHR